MSKLPEGFSRAPIPAGVIADDFRDLITIGVSRGGQIGIILENDFGDLCKDHNEVAITILAAAPKLLTDMAEQLLRKQ